MKNILKFETLTTDLHYEKAYLNNVFIETTLDRAHTLRKVYSTWGIIPEIVTPNGTFTNTLALEKSDMIFPNAIKESVSVYQGDFVPGDLYKAVEDGNTIVCCTANYQTTFSGIVVDSTTYEIGYDSKYWLKSTFEPFDTTTLTKPKTVFKKGRFYKSKGGDPVIVCCLGNICTDYFPGIEITVDAKEKISCFWNKIEFVEISINDIKNL